jgi:hypothetical protein
MRTAVITVLLVGLVGLVALAVLPFVFSGALPEPAQPVPEILAESPMPVPPSDLKHLGGRWYLREGETPSYFYREGGRYTELFANRGRDTNMDGTPDLVVSHDEKFLILRTQNLPDHPTGIFPNNKNPNSIVPQRFVFRIPLVPRKADRITRVPMGPIGVATNGVVFFNPFEAGGINAVEGYAEVWLDSCCGHPQQTGVYHYHKYPTCVKTPFVDDGKQHSPPIGFAWDGFPLYGPHEQNGVLAKDLTGDRALDVCNGHEDAERGYHYHVTPGKFPYLLGGYAGVPELSNSPPLARAGTGAIQDNARGTSREGLAIEALRPGTGARGKTVTLHLELAEPTRDRWTPDATPSRLVVGPYETAKLTREGRTITAELTIPPDANPGAMLDCHLEFQAPGGRIFTVKKNDVFRIGE